MVAYLYDYIGADCLITLGDLFTFNVRDMPTHEDFCTMRGKGAIWVAIAPFDHDPLGMGDIAALDAITVPIAISQHGKAMMEKAGYGCVYIPHGIDTKNAFNKDVEGGIKFRQFHSIPQDAFLITFVGYNRGVPPTRKGIEYLLQAVGDLNKEGYEDIHVYLHTDPIPMGDMMGAVHIPKLAVALDVGGDKVTVHLPDPRHHILGYDNAYLRAMYNAGDVFCLPSGGEGFGIPLIEAQSSYSPVICTHWTSMPELVGGGWTVGYAALQVAVTMSSKRAIVDLKQLKEAILLARDTKLNHPKEWIEIKEKARKHAMNYDSSTIYANMWKPFIANLETMVAKVNNAKVS